jgi:hypothetical protein
MLNFKKLITLIVVAQLFSGAVFSKENATEASKPQVDLNLQEIALPSEVKDLDKHSGSIFYNNSVRNKVLVPVHIWGEIKQSGLHFMPTDTTLIKGLSLAGGPNSAAKLEDVIVIRNSSEGKSKEFKFDLSEGGDASAHQFKIESGDTIFLKKDTFFENRSYYTGLVGIVVTILSTFIIVQKVK